MAETRGGVVSSTRRAAALAALLAVVAVGCGSGGPEVSVGSPTTTEASTSTTCIYSDTNPCGSQGPDPAFAGPDGCGLEVNDCGGANPAVSETGPATCTTESYQEAVRSNIDGGSFVVLDAMCDGTWAAFTVDRSRDACPASDDPQPGCALGTRADRTFWLNAEGHWVILAFQGDAGGCGEVLAVAPDFPPAFCEG